MSAPLTLGQRLQRFSETRWMRAIYAKFSNVTVRPLVTAGYLEEREAPALPGQPGVRVREYQLTELGRQVIEQEHAA